MVMRLNPIVKKDIRVQARSMKIAWGLFAYEAIMALVFFLAMSFFQMENIYSSTNIYSQIVMLYPVLAVTQIGILAVVVPIITASSISGEKERQTFDIMMTTSMTPFSIIVGKVTTAMNQGLLFVVAAMPIMALAFVIGGLSWAYLLWFLLIAMLVSLFSASIGICCSALCKKSIVSVIMSYGIYIVFIVLTCLPTILYMMWGYQTAAASMTMGMMVVMLFYLINPVYYLVEFFVWTMTGTSGVYEIFQEIFDDMNMKIPFGEAVWHYGWMTVSTVLFLFVSFLFLLLAAKKINPISKGRAKKLAQLELQRRMHG